MQSLPDPAGAARSRPRELQQVGLCPARGVHSAGALGERQPAAGWQDESWTPSPWPPPAMSKGVPFQQPWGKQTEQPPG